MSEIWVDEARLECILGYDVAVRLLRAVGGLTVYIPKSADADHFLIPIVGAAGVRALSSEYGGERIGLPNGRREAAKRQILEMLAAGHSHRAVALETGVSERYVRLVAAERPGIRQAALPLCWD